MNPTGHENGDGEPMTQSSDSAVADTRDLHGTRVAGDLPLPRRVPQPSQLRGQPAITPAQPGEKTLRHLRDVLDRLA